MNSCRETCDRNLLQTDQQGLNSIHPPSFLEQRVWIYSVQFCFIYGLCYLHREEESSFPGNHSDKLRKLCCKWCHYYIFHNCSHNVLHRSQVHSLGNGDTEIEIYSFFLGGGGIEKGNIFCRKKKLIALFYHEYVFVKFYPITYVKHFLKQRKQHQNSS